MNCSRNNGLLEKHLKQSDKIDSISEIHIDIIDVHSHRGQLLIHPLGERLLLHLNPSGFFNYKISAQTARGSYQEQYQT